MCLTAQYPEPQENAARNSFGPWLVESWIKSTESEKSVNSGCLLETVWNASEVQYSIRINQQYRICFQWENGHACEVEITDYH